MARVLTNATAFAVARQTSRGVLGGSPVWRGLEPNNISAFGASIETVARSPISKNRQRRKGTVVNVESTVEYDCDATIDSLLLFAEGFCFATATNTDLTFRGAAATSSGYTIPPATAAQAGKIRWTSGGPITLVYAAGYALAANNGIKPLTADVAAAGTLITVSGNAAETPPTNAEVSVCGIRCEAGDLAVVVSAGIATLTSGNGAASNPVNFTTLGLTVGQRVHVGGLTSTNRFFGAGPIESYGSGRVRTIAAGQLVLDKLDDTLITSDGTATGAGGAEKAVDLLFGRFVRNVPVDDDEFLELYHQFEAEYPNLFETDPPTPVAEPDGYEYAKDNLCNEMTWNMGLADKSTVTFGFIGTDTEPPVDGASRKTNAATPISPLFTGAFNTAADFARLRIAEVDDTGLLTDFKELALSLNNNVSAEGILGTLGAAYLNYGNFDVGIEGVALFTSGAVVQRIRDNTTVTMDWLLRNDDGAVHTDIPSMDLGSDGKEYPVNESVRIALTGTAHADTFFGTSIGISFFPVYPEAA